jgi:hypothetical protein
VLHPHHIHHQTLTMHSVTAWMASRISRYGVLLPYLFTRLGVGIISACRVRFRVRVRVRD